MPVDLEDLAEGYSHRPTSDRALSRARRAGGELNPGDIAVDVGGGRGTHAGVWAQRGALAVVVDPSERMTSEAARLPGVAVIRGTSQRLPVRSGTVRLVYFHLSIHYGDWRIALEEAYRVLDPGGECWIWTMGEEHHRASFLAKWFPSVGDIDSARFPDPVEVAEYLGERWAGVSTGREIERKTMPAGQWKAAVEARFVSTLQLVPDGEFEAGLTAFEANHPDPEEPVEYVLTFDWLRASK